MIKSALPGRRYRFAQQQGHESKAVYYFFEHLRRLNCYIGVQRGG